MTDRDPWEQLPGESVEAYARFLYYRNCGFGRSFRKAYRKYLQATDGYTGGVRGLQPPGCWVRDAGDHFWKSRARAWDLRNLHTYGGRVAVLHTQALVSIAEKNARCARRMSPGDDGWPHLISSVRLVQEYLTPEVMRGQRERGRAGRESVPAAGDDGVT
jgi:hypothetical protein